MTQIMLNLSPETAARLEQEARSRGVTPEALAAEALQAWVADDDLDWAEDVRRLEEPGEDIDVNEAFDRFNQDVAAERTRLKKAK